MLFPPWQNPTQNASVSVTSKINNVFTFIVCCGCFYSSNENRTKLPVFKQQ